MLSTRKTAQFLGVIIGVLLAFSAQALTEYQRTQITQHLDNPKMNFDQSIFDGKAFNPAASLDNATTYYSGYVDQMNRAVRGWNMLSNSDKQSADAQALLARLQEKLAWSRAMEAAYPAFREAKMSAPAAAPQTVGGGTSGTAPVLQQQAGPPPAPTATTTAGAAATTQDQKAVHRAACLAFQENAMKPLNRDPMIRLINQILHGNSQIASADQVEDHARVATEVKGVCESTDLEMMRSQPCWYVLNRPDHDPLRWCEAANNMAPLIQAAALNHAKSVVQITGTSTFQSPQELRERDGFLTFEGPVTFNDRLFFSGNTLGNVQGTVDELLRSAGIEDADQALWGEQAQRVDELRAEVEKLAGTWEIPQNAADNYSTAIAADQVRRMHGDANVHDAFLSRATWKIHRNALGAILRRTMPGYVVFKLPEDPFCQLRPYTLTEQYTGAGNYQQAAGVSFGYVRFQNCP